MKPSGYCIALPHHRRAAVAQWSRSCRDLARQINSEVDRDDIQELRDSHNQELAVDELIEMHKQEQDIEELESLDPFQSEDRITVGNLTEELSLIEKGLQILENIHSNEERFFPQPNKE
ncbi:hypothetical protein TNCV_4829961 [Trichonephila clavipes]|nr:hypothetical protein TNCV_4829961 [Trichonephila clavipes]